MTLTSRERVGLAAVAVVLVAAWWVSRSGDPDGRPGAPATRRAQSAAPLPTAGAEVPVVEMARLGSAKPESDETGRDPFRFGRAKPMVAEPGPAPARAVRPVGAGVTATPTPGVTVPAGPPPPPPISLKYIGVVRREGDQARIAVLSDSGGVYYGREGDVIEGRYRVGRITDDTVEIAYVDGRGRQVIRLSGS